MFGIFKSKSKTKLDKLTKQHRKLLEEAFKLSKIDRKASDLKYAEAEELLREIESLKSLN